MKHIINPGPPVITAVQQTEDGYSLGTLARTLCLVDGYAAEIRHTIRVRHQEQNQHILSVFDPRDMLWQEIIRWDYAEGGQIPLHPDADTIARLTEISTAMWHEANVIVAQSRLRQQEIDIDKHVKEQMAFQSAMLDAYTAEAAKERPDMLNIARQPIVTTPESESGE